MTIPAGQLRWRLKLQKPVASEDPDYGGTNGTPTFVDVADVRARRRNTLKATQEALAAGTTVAMEQVSWGMRPRAIDASWRLVGVGGSHDGVIYDIKNFGLSNDGSELEVLTISGANHG
jgi:head-tail adaptor